MLQFKSTTTDFVKAVAKLHEVNASLSKLVGTGHPQRVLKWCEDIHTAGLDEVHIRIVVGDLNSCLSMTLGVLARMRDHQQHPESNFYPCENGVVVGTKERVDISLCQQCLLYRPALSDGE